MCQVEGHFAPVVKSLATLLVLRLLQKSVQYQYIVLAGAETNLTVDNADSEIVAAATSWLYTCRYLLPVLGGLLACWLGHVRVLQLGGLALLVSTAVMLTAVYMDMWRGGCWLALAACLLMPVFNGLVMPNMMHGVLSKPTQPRHRTVLCALIDAFSAAGFCAGVGLLELQPLLGEHYVLACFAVVLAYNALAVIVLPRVEADARVVADTRALRRIELPTLNRLKRCCLVFTVVVPYLIGLTDDRATVFKAEKQFLQAAMTNESVQSSSVIEDGGNGARGIATATVLAVGQVAANFGLMTAACLVTWRHGRMPIWPRLAGGLCLQGALELVLSLICAGAIQFPDPSWLNPFFTVASSVDATSEVLVMIAAYEVMDNFERDATRPLIIGVMMTVWGLGHVISRVLVMLCSSRHALMFVYHPTLLAFLAASLLYMLFFAIPMARTLYVIHDVENLEVNRRSEALDMREDAETSRLIRNEDWTERLTFRVRGVSS